MIRRALASIVFATLAPIILNASVTQMGAPPANQTFRVADSIRLAVVVTDPGDVSVREATWRVTLPSGGVLADAVYTDLKLQGGVSVMTSVVDATTGLTTLTIKYTVAAPVLLKGDVGYVQVRCAVRTPVGSTVRLTTAAEEVSSMNEKLTAVASAPTAYTILPRGLNSTIYVK